ncbi:hypothetical protein AVEN_111728-1 [Araneus ventricosus]|uniref:RNase H type-1 domain-containing protein n=1 Tax=Araneus ventricosus TaxID=182803 RepID=A0A4Y2CA06_ARAVE|nr:hypothetical protein AVEN_111728-1 [Araneus ventricosus]
MGQPPCVYNLQSESQENSQQFNIRSFWQSQLPTGQPQRQLCRLSAHPLELLIPTQISLDDGGNTNTGFRIYTDGSKTEKGVGATFCVLTDVNIFHRWSTRLSLRNTVFQTEILALLKAVEHAVALNNWLFLWTTKPASNQQQIKRVTIQLPGKSASYSIVIPASECRGSKPMQVT